MSEPFKGLMLSSLTVGVGIELATARTIAGAIAGAGGFVEMARVAILVAASDETAESFIVVELTVEALPIAILDLVRMEKVKDMLWGT